MLSRIRAKSFLSWEDLNYPIVGGASLIDGWNEDDGRSEGSGKSAILNVISWVAFGKLPKDANVDDVIMDNRDSCECSLEFDDGDSIVRTRNPNQLYIMKQGAVVKGKDAKETQTMIEEYLGLNFESFCQAVYFAQNYDKKFLTSGQADKGKILSGIQNLKVFDKGVTEAQSLIKLEKDTLGKLKIQLQTEELNLNNNRTQMALVRSFIEEKVKSHQQQKNMVIQQRNLVTGHIKASETSLESIVQKISQIDIPSLDRDLSELSAVRADYANQFSQIQFQKSQIDSIKKTVSSKEQEGKNLANRYNSLLATSAATSIETHVTYLHLMQQKKNAMDFQKSASYKMSQAKKVKLEEYLKNPSANCPSCGQELKNPDLSHTQTELNSINNELSMYASNSASTIESVDAQLLSFQTQFKENLESVNSEMAQILIQLEEVSNYLDTNKVPDAAQLDAAGMELNNLILQIDQAATQTNMKKSEHAQLTNQHQMVSNQKMGYDQQLQQIEAQLSQIAEPDIAQDNKKIAAFDQAIVTGQEAIEGINGLIEKSNLHLQRLETLKEGFKEIKSFVFNNAINSLNHRANKYLSELFDMEATIKFTNEDQEIQTEVTLGGRKRSLGLLSGGQGRRFHLAVDMALADIVSFRGMSKLGILIFDEYFKDLSEISMDKALELLRSKKCPIILIEHNSIFKNFIENTFFVRYKNKVSFESSP